MAGDDAAALSRWRVDPAAEGTFLNKFTPINAAWASPPGRRPCSVCWRRPKFRNPSRAMNQPLVDKIVNAVLCGDIFSIPTVPTSKKMPCAFLLVVFIPEAYSIVQEGAEPCMMQTECLLSTHAGPATLHVKVRFLHTLVAARCASSRSLFPLLDGRRARLPAHGGQHFKFNAGGKLYHRNPGRTPSADAQRDVDTGLLPVSQLVVSPSKILFSFPASCARELIHDEETRGSRVCCCANRKPWRGRLKSPQLPGRCAGFSKFPCASSITRSGIEDALENLSGKPW